MVLKGRGSNLLSTRLTADECQGIRAQSHPRSLPAFDLEESDGGDCLDPDGPGIRRR